MGAKVEVEGSDPRSLDEALNDALQNAARAAGPHRIVRWSLKEVNGQIDHSAGKSQIKVTLEFESFAKP
jgi:flavin-binding protein dodecin